MSSTAVYAVRIKDRDILMKSSSGGAFTALSYVFLQKGDAVVSSVYNYEKNEMGFAMIQSYEGLDAARGSKYMQSKPGDIFRKSCEWIKANPGKKILFVGMGCQADGYRKYTEAAGIRDNVFIVDIICHGTPSTKLWKQYVSGKVKDGDIEFLTFKDKRNGWKHPTAYIRNNGDEISIQEYVNIFYGGCTLRPSCHACPFATVERKTDMTIGDFWGIDLSIPEFYDDRGNSLLLIHTDRGMKLFDMAKKSVDYYESNEKECLQYNLEHPTPESPLRQKFWREFQRHGVDYIVNKYGKDTLYKKLKHKLTRIIGGGVFS